MGREAQGRGTLTVAAGIEASTRLSAAGVAQYLRERRVLAADVTPEVRELSGGISNTVLGVEWPNGAVVVKQSLARLRVAENWEFDPRRILVEAECMQALGDLLAPGEAPKVIDVDRDLLAFTMTRAPAGGIVWKEALLSGAPDHDAAPRAGALLGRLHRAAAARPELAARFEDLMPLLEGRVEPYHRTAALAHPDLGPFIEADVERLTTKRRTLVLGDFSPKNLIVYPDHLLALDFEVAHWGDPAFDTAFMLTHLVAKAVHLPQRRQALLAAARVFWSSYLASAGPAGATETNTATELSVLLLCRVDGKSKLEYLGDAHRAFLRGLARELISDPPQEVGDVIATVADRLRSAPESA